MYCRNCGSKINDKAEYCPSCNCKPLSNNLFCQECGTETHPIEKICPKCGAKLKTSINNSTDKIFNSKNFFKDLGEKFFNEDTGALNLDFSNLKPYYQAEFTKIHESNETYKGKWNWFAFLFGGLWAVTKGAWIAGFIELALCSLTHGYAAIVYAVIFGIRGNYLYYNFSVKNKQLFI